MSEERNITRREFIKRAGGMSAAVALGASLWGAKSWSAKVEKPNILFIIADDWSWPHAGVCGDKFIKTPNFDRVAGEGVLFTNSFCAAPTCTASRGGILSGQAIHRLGEGANLWSTLPKEIPVYPDLLEDAGYYVGFTGKGWSPGQVEPGGRTRNPAGPGFKNFGEFLDAQPEDKPFCFWFGSYQPHRAYETGVGVKSGLKPEDVEVPPFLPDTPEVRSDLLDYYHHAMRYDAEVGRLLQILDERGLVENTLVVVTSDNGMPFPRAKCNLYDSGTRMPLAIRWPARIKGGRQVDTLTSHTDFASTFLEAAGLKPLPEMTGRSLMPVLEGKAVERECVYTERERHTHNYPMRAVRTHEFLYIRNMQPDRWPAAMPPPGQLGDIDASPTKDVMVNGRDDEVIGKYYERACGKRPEEELYDVNKDPWQLNNLAADPDYAETRRKMRARLDKWMLETGDRRAHGETDFWDKCPELR